MGSSEPPEIYCDFNGRVKERRYLLTRGTYDDLAGLGLTPETAVGVRFLLNGGPDIEDGVPSTIMCYGEVVRDADFQYLMLRDGEIFWRPV